MFRFLELSLHGWDLWPNVRIPLDRSVVLVTGPNGSGKTTLLDALRQILNAPRLSSRRRLQHYLRRPDAPALVHAVVTNETSENGTSPFRHERIDTPVATLACALIPGPAGVPEKRFAILRGRATVDDLRKILLESRDFYPPERYARALERAGVTRSLMGVLAIEQGRMNTLFELRPRELFTYVLGMLGDQKILERYREARVRFEETQKEVFHQRALLQQRQVELGQLSFRVQERERWEQARDKVHELETRLPASELQLVWRARQESEPKILELRTKIRNGEAERIRLTGMAVEAKKHEDRERSSVGKARAYESACREQWGGAVAASAALQERVKGLEEMALEAASLPEVDLTIVVADLENARHSEFTARRSSQESADRRSRLEADIGRLRKGLPVYPEAVYRTLAEIQARGITVTLLADIVDASNPAQGAAVEAALGDVRYSLLVANGQISVVEQVALENRFPGPIYQGECVEAEENGSWLRFRRGVPKWLTRWVKGVTLESDGTWKDERGTWVARVEDRVLGSQGLQATLSKKEAEYEQAIVEAADRGKATVAAEALRVSLEEAVRGERRRQELLVKVSDLSAVRSEVQQLDTHVQLMKRNLDQAQIASQQAAERLFGVVQHREDVDRRLAATETHLTGERQALEREERTVHECDEKILELEPTVGIALLDAARRGELDGPDTVRRDLERARLSMESLGQPPPESIREEYEHMRANIEEHGRHLAERQREADSASTELAECRNRYLEIVDSALQDYRRRAVELGRRAGVAVEMDLPRLSNEDRVLDEAGIEARFGFDGKDPLALGDSSFSGGQQVITGLILLMAMAETEGQGFFLLDEPFAHLSLDRVDDVGKFLRSTKSQFILTAPTTLDRAQLDPASLVIVMQKKRPDQPEAPIPLVAIV